MRGDTDKFNPSVSPSQMENFLRKQTLKRNGFHIGFEDRFVLNILDEMLEPGQLFPIQIASGPLLSMSKMVMYSPSDLMLSLIASKKIKLILHLPFVINPYKSPDFNSYVDSYLCKLISLYPEEVYFVLHASYPTGVDTSYANFTANLTRWLSLSKNHILIENLAGSSKHQENFASPITIWNNFFNKDKNPYYINSHKLGICLDTEHAWASGVSYQELSSFIKEHHDVIKLVHWNAAPCSAGFSKHRDQHSWTPFSVDLKRNHMWSWEPGDTNYDFNDFINLITELDIPTIFERGHLSIQLSDLHVVNSSSSFNT